MGTRSLRANSAAAGENSSVLTREAALFRPYINRLRVLSVGQAAELTAEPAEEFTGEFAAEQRNSSGIRRWTHSMILKRLLRVCDWGSIPATFASSITLNATVGCVSPLRINSPTSSRVNFLLNSAATRWLNRIWP